MVSQDTTMNNGGLTRSKTTLSELETKAFPLSPKLQNRPLQEKTQEQDKQEKENLCCVFLFLFFFPSLWRPPFYRLNEEMLQNQK